jgi:hypothetical protein
LKWEPLKSIIIKTGYSERTISYRKKEIFNKIEKYFF